MPNCAICSGNLENLPRNQTKQKYKIPGKECDCGVHELCWRKVATRFERKSSNKFICKNHTCVFCRNNNGTDDSLQCHCVYHRNCYRMIQENISFSSTDEFEVKATSSDIEPHRLPYCIIHDCGLCRTGFTVPTDAIQLSCGCLMHTECMYENPPMLGTQCPLCFYKLKAEDFAKYNKASGILSYISLGWTSYNRSKLFNKEFIDKRTDTELKEIGITIDDLLIAGFTFVDLLETIHFDKKSLGEMGVTCTHINNEAYEWLLKQENSVDILTDLKLTFPLLKKKFTYLQLKCLRYRMKELVEHNFTKEDFFKNKIIPMSEFKQYFDLDKDFLINHLKLNPLDYKRIFATSPWTRKDLIDVFKFNTEDLKTVDLPLPSATPLPGSVQSESVISIFGGWGFTGFSKEEEQPATETKPVFDKAKLTAWN